MSIADPLLPVTSQPVLVTGVSGFIGLHVARTLLARGYSVRGSVRSLDRVEGLRQALQRDGQPIERFDCVRLELMSDAGFTEALRGVSHVIHVASPVPTRPPRHEDELIVPAREGTLRVLRAASAAGVSRVVMTSSISAIIAGHPCDGTHVFDESDWSQLDGSVSAYDKSKTIAELAAWDFVRSLPDQRKMELVTINPGFVLGPILDSDPGVTNQLVLKLVKRQVPGIPNMNFPVVDVRDVAELHCQALSCPNVAGQRFCCALPSIHVEELARLLQEAGFRVPTRRIPDWVLRLVALVDKQVALVVADLGKRTDFDCTRAKTVLGWQPRRIEDTLLDTATSLQAAG